VSGFDIIYATLDEEFDRAHGIHSLVAWLGRRPALQISAGLHLMAFGALAMMAAMSWALAVRPLAGSATVVAGAAILGSLLVASVLLFLEQRWAENVNLAFFRVNVWVGAAVLLMVLAGRILG
jgi:4-hydroxybenzoate polyprenyltransferase